MRNIKAIFYDVKEYDKEFFRKYGKDYNNYHIFVLKLIEKQNI